MLLNLAVPLRDREHWTICADCRQLDDVAHAGGFCLIDHFLLEIEAVQARRYKIKFLYTNESCFYRRGVLEFTFDNLGVTFKLSGLGAVAHEQSWPHTGSD